MIIGAGIGGLTTAIALRSFGINIDIYEAAENLQSVGAGILIPPNAMRVLAQLGLEEKMRESGNELDSLQITDHCGKIISTTSSSYDFSNRSFKTIAIHRGKLHEILRNCFIEDSIHLGCRLEKIINSEKSLEVHFENGHRQTADFIIGADGLRSKTRQAIISTSVMRDSGQICWRGVANISLADDWKSQLTELWGNGTRFGFVSISNDQVYWYATIVDTLNESTKADHVTGYLKSVFSSYVSTVREIIDSTPSGSIIEGHIFDIKPLEVWCNKNIVLLGDAAHAITPNLGQGGALAIEDAFDIAHKLAHCSDINSAFEMFQKTRKHRVNKISKASRVFGKITNWHSPWACSLRNSFMRSIPRVITTKQSDSLYNFEINTEQGTLSRSINDSSIPKPRLLVWRNI